MKVGVAISPDTPSTAITDDIGNAADMLLVMTVYPGSPNSLSSNARLMHE
jgi:ribulose-phosphate 3-epimerase